MGEYKVALISDFSLDFFREPLKKPFGFKGGFLSELWQVVCCVCLDDGRYGTGIGVQSVLWSDEKTFCSHSQTGGNTLMLSVTEYALQSLRGQTMQPPPVLQKKILPDVYRYACQVTGNDRLPMTFALNALVAVDFALWQLWAQMEKAASFDAICDRFSPQMCGKQQMLGEIPLLSYQTSDEEIRQQLETGAFLFKIKIGSNPNGSGDTEAMIEWDAHRLCHIHQMAKEYTTPYTECGHPVYYLDANGRYPDRAALLRFLKKAADCGALERVVLLEEPFAENNLQDVAGIPVRVAADESAHCAADVVKLIEKYHYGAIALKPIAKTLSATLEMYGEAQKHGVPCFCADLTVPPAMLEWNMQVAARLQTLPGLKIGIVESNGPQNYTDWQKLKQLHPLPGAQWLTSEGHVFCLTPDFYSQCAAFWPYDAYIRRIGLKEGEQV